MEEEQSDGEATTPSGSPLSDQSLSNSTSSTLTEVVEASGGGANAAGREEKLPESSEGEAISKQRHGSTTATSASPGASVKVRMVLKHEHDPRFHEAVSFVEKVQNRFSRFSDNKYRSFLDILDMYLINQNLVEVQQEMDVLLRDHSDLLEEFRNFLPDGYQSSSIPFGLKIDVQEIKQDALIHKVASTTKKVEKMIETIQCGVDVKIEDHLTPSDLRCAEELYGLDFLDNLHEKAVATLPALLARLKQKLEELSVDSEEALAHLSSCSKQQDPKS
ncbi:SIN3-like 3 [Canna indica]|uniref:SIN3-like 3 n=1 Tax=Canna indica TaxID=4628 RepID=A0AAQ3Q3D1_9LILI|nr:SIN3-like 3 [Canna indica]